MNLNLYVLSIIAFIAGQVGATSPSDYADACIGLLTSIYMWGDCGMGMWGADACVCSNTDFVKTTVRCINMLSVNDTSSPLADTKTNAYLELINSCPNATMSELRKYDEAAGELEPANGFPGGYGMWQATRAFAPSPQEVYDAYNSYMWNTYGSYSYCWRFGAATLAYFGGVMLIRAFFYWSLKLCPRISQSIGSSRVITYTRKYAILPPLLNRYHSEAYSFCRFFTMNLPTRLQSLIVFLFFALHIGATFGTTTYYPNYSWNYSYSETLNYFLGRTSGYLIVFDLPLLVIFAGRNNFFQWLTGWPQDVFVIYHKWIGRIIIIDTIIHTVTYTVLRFQQHRYASMWESAYWNWGVVALVFACLIFVQAVHMIRRRGYETFLIIHIIAAIIFIVGSYWHMKLLDATMNFFWATFACWGFERAVRLIRIFWSNPFATVEVKQCDRNVVQLTISYSQRWKITAGQHVFIHFLRPAFFWESHPFSVTPPIAADDEGKLILFCRAKTGMTRRLLTFAGNCSSSANVFIDGPYGGLNHNVQDFENNLFVGGGIGVTVIFSYIHMLIRENASPGKNIVLCWSIADEEPLRWFGQQIDYMVNSGRVQLEIYIGGNTADIGANEHGTSVSSNSLSYAVNHMNPTFSNEAVDQQAVCSGLDSTDSSPKIESKDPIGMKGADILLNEQFSNLRIHYSRMKTQETVSDYINASTSSMSVLVCGPGSMNDDVRLAVIGALPTTKGYVELFDESFSW